MLRLEYTEPVGFVASKDVADIFGQKVVIR